MFPPTPPAARPFVARSRRSGFSLVEVVLAVGVISFAFVAILGLLPAGMQQFRQAMDNSVAAQVSQRIIQDAQLSDFDVLCNTTSLNTDTTYVRARSYSVSDAAKLNPIYTRYFDEQGNEVIPQGQFPSTTELAVIVYHVNTRIEPFATLPGNDPTKPMPRTQPILANLVVQVAFNPSNRAIQIDPTTQKFSDTDVKSRNMSVRTFTAQVGRNF